MERLAAHLLMLLDALPSCVDHPVSSLPLLTGNELHTLLEQWAATDMQFQGKDKCYHQLFEEQAAMRPDKLLVLDEQRSKRLSTNIRRPQFANHA